MVFKKKLITALISGAFAAGLAGATQAAVVYNSTLGSFGAGTPASLFGNFTTDTNFALGTFEDSAGNDIEVGLRARYRIRPDEPSTAGGVYGPFNAGTQTAFGALPARSDRAEWSYDFYIDTNGSTAPLSFSLCADLDRSGGFTPDCVDPLTFFTDNRTNGTELGNSMQLFFAGTPGNSTYDVNSFGLYTFQLTALEGGVAFGTTEIVAQVVPEPGTLAILGLGLAGLGFARRKKQA